MLQLNVQPVTAVTNHYHRSLKELPENIFIYSKLTYIINWLWLCSRKQISVSWNMVRRSRIASPYPLM